MGHSCCRGQPGGRRGPSDGLLVGRIARALTDGLAGTVQVAFVSWRERFDAFSLCGYWHTFFPASLVLGLGMAVTVAPLTTVVMSSVDKEHSGAASGINNAMARIAGVLAIAVFGIVMVKIFATHLDRRLPSLLLAPETAQGIRSKEIELAGMELPQSLDANASSALKNAV